MQLEVKGRENLSGTKPPLVFMPNHISYLDSLALLLALPPHIRRKIAFAAARDVVYKKYKSIAGLLELYFNSFPFPRKENEDIRSGLEYMGRMLDAGWSAVVYPEGRMSENGALQPLKRGAGLIAVAMDAYIVPVKISGTNAIVPYARILPRKRGKVSVAFGTPMKFSRRDSYIEATEKIQEALQTL